MPRIEADQQPNAVVFLWCAALNYRLRACRHSTPHEVGVAGIDGDRHPLETWGRAALGVRAVCRFGALEHLLKQHPTHLFSNVLSNEITRREA
ncbi:hypothetical protein ACFQ95_00310 [Variovorax sp. HJSM1_2]